MTLILINIIQVIILNNTREIFSYRLSTLGNVNADDTVTFKHYNSKNTS